MPLQGPVVRDAYAAQGHVIAGHELVDVISISRTDIRDICHEAKACSFHVTLRRQLDVSRRGGNDPHRKPESLGNGRIVSVGILAGCHCRFMGSEYLRKHETLGRLRAEQMVARYGRLDDHVRACALQRVRNCIAGQGSHARSNACNYAINDLAGYERPGGIVDEHLARLPVSKGRKPAKNAFLPRAAARNRRKQPTAVMPRGMEHRLFVQGGVIGMDDDLHDSYFGMIEKGLSAPRQDSFADEVAILLRTAGSAHPFAAAGGNDHDGIADHMHAPAAKVGQSTL
jgi:hypothetical protein